MRKTKEIELLTVEVRAMTERAEEDRKEFNESRDRVQRAYLECDRQRQSLADRLAAIPESITGEVRQLDAKVWEARRVHVGPSGYWVEGLGTHPTKAAAVSAVKVRTASATAQWERVGN
jgi:hypothetical protein